MNNIYIILKEYNNQLAKRQPWYTIKKLILDFEERGYEVKVVKSLKLVPKKFKGKVIKVLSLKDFFVLNKGNFQLFFLITFPLYSISKFLKIPLRIIYQNWSDLNRIIFASLLPFGLKIYTLNKASNNIIISDRSLEFMQNKINYIKYITFQFDNWGWYKKSKKTSNKKTIGYFGPPFSTRDFPELINFFNWLHNKNIDYRKKIITRIERDELVYLEKKQLKKIKSDKNFKFISGFLERNKLARELMEIDVLILSFKIVMSELPIVVLEALELGIPVVTTKESGIHLVAKNQQNILFIDNFKKERYVEILEFINNVSYSNFNDLRNNINNINQIALNKICQN